MGVFKLFILLCLVVNVCYSQPAGSRLTLALEDTFDTFNLSLWQHEITLAGGGNWEFQAYLNNRSSSYVRDGIMYIKPVLMSDQIGEAGLNSFTMDLWGGAPADACTWNQFYGCMRTGGAGGNILNPIKSARLRTAYSFNFKYGKMEIKAKLPRGDWLWPAIALLPRYQAYGIWPASGEIDILDSRGNAPGYPAGGYDSFFSTMHWGINHALNFHPISRDTKSGVDLTADFHTYGLIWNETYIGTYFDDESNVVLSYPINQTFFLRSGLHNGWDNPWAAGGTDAPFDREFYITMKLAVGGTGGYFPDNVGGKPWNDTDGNAVNKFWAARSQWLPTWNLDGGDTAALQIDSVRVWTYQLPPSSTQNSAYIVLSPIVVLLAIAIVTYIAIAGK